MKHKLLLLFIGGDRLKRVLNLKLILCGTKSNVIIIIVITKIVNYIF